MIFASVRLHCELFNHILEFCSSVCVDSKRCHCRELTSATETRFKCVLKPWTWTSFAKWCQFSHRQAEGRSVSDGLWKINYFWNIPFPKNDVTSSQRSHWSVWVSANRRWMWAFSVALSWASSCGAGICKYPCPTLSMFLVLPKLKTLLFFHHFVLSETCRLMFVETSFHKYVAIWQWCGDEESHKCAYSTSLCLFHRSIEANREKGDKWRLLQSEPVGCADRPPQGHVTNYLRRKSVKAEKKTTKKIGKCCLIWPVPVDSIAPDRQQLKKTHTKTLNIDKSWIKKRSNGIFTSIHQIKTLVFGAAEGFTQWV